MKVISRVPELRAAIDASGMTQGEVALKARINQGILSRVVNRRALIDQADADRLARVLKVSASDLGAIIR